MKIPYLKLSLCARNQFLLLRNDGLTMYFVCMSDATPIEIEEYAKRGQDVPAGQSYLIRIDKEKIIVNVDHLTGKEILGLVKKDPKDFKLFEHVRGNQPKEIQPDEIVFFTKKGIERFSTFAKDTTEGARGRAAA